MTTLVTLDFETYYNSKDFSLKNITTEEYLRDPRFQVIGVGVKVDDGPAFWVDDLDGGVAGALACLDLQDCMVLAHNTMFDGAILGWHYGIQPRMLLDTQNMARYIHRDPRQSMSLAALARLYGVGEKGTEVVQADGKRLEDFGSVQLKKYGGYCMNDVELTFRLFRRMMQEVPESELKIIDHTLRMFTDPRVVLDREMLEQALTNETVRRQATMDKLLKGAPLDQLKKVLRSKKVFVSLLQSAGVEPPMKISKDTGKPTYAFAKTDKAFTALLEHSDEEVRALVECKLDVNSSIEETRLRRFLGIAERGLLPVPLRYFGAHTGRYSGDGKINMQNLPRIGALRNALQAPDGYQFIVSDASQIEARLMAYCAGQQDLVEQFTEGVDVYSAFGTQVFGREITKADKEERFACKVSILQLQYGSGKARFHTSLTDGSQGMKIDIDRAEADRIHDLYRDTYQDIKVFWRLCDKALRNMVSGGHGTLSYAPTVMYNGDHLYLPDRLVMRYTNIRRDSDGDLRYVRYYKGGEKKIYGAMMAENIMQALARQFIMGCLLRIMDRRTTLRYVMQVHDELIFLCPEEHVEGASKLVHEEMSTPPEWAEDLPVAAETASGDRYGSAK